MEYGQFRAEVEWREIDHEQKMKENEQLRDEGLHNGRVGTLSQTVPFGPTARHREKEKAHPMLVDVKRHQKRRGKVKSMYIPKPVYVTTDASQGGDHMVTSRESVSVQSKSVPRNVQSVPVNVSSLRMRENGKIEAQQSVRSLSEGKTALLILRSQLGSNQGVELDIEDVELDIEDVVIIGDGVGKQEERERMKEMEERAKERE